MRGLEREGVWGRPAKRARSGEDGEGGLQDLARDGKGAEVRLADAAAQEELLASMAEELERWKTANQRLCALAARVVVENGRPGD